MGALEYVVVTVGGLALGALFALIHTLMHFSDLRERVKRHKPVYLGRGVFAFLITEREYVEIMLKNQLSSKHEADAADSRDQAERAESRLLQVKYEHATGGNKGWSDPSV